MKTSLLLASAVLLSATALADEGDEIGSLTTISGKTFHGVTIAQVYPDGVAFRHAKGAGKVLYSDLPSDLRRRLGYDSRKAEAYEKQLADQREKERAARVERSETFAKAQLLAQQTAAKQESLLAAQYFALASQQAAYANYSYPVAVPAVGLSSGVIGGVTQFRHGYHRYPSGYRGPWLHHDYHRANLALTRYGITIGNGVRPLSNDVVYSNGKPGKGRPGHQGHPSRPQQDCGTVGPVMPSRVGTTFGLVRNLTLPAPAANFTNGVPALNASFTPAVHAAPRAAVVVGGGRR